MGKAQVCKRGQYTLRHEKRHTECSNTKVVILGKMGQDARGILIKQSQAKCVLVGHYLHSGSVRGSRGVVILIVTWREQPRLHKMITPFSGCKFIIIDNCPHWGMVYSARFCCSLWIVSVLCQKDVNQSCHYQYPRWLNERDLAKETDAKWRQECQVFILLLVNLLAKIRNQCFFSKSSF
jgi:hypothetical protein